MMKYLILLFLLISCERNIDKLSKTEFYENGNIFRIAYHNGEMISFYSSGSINEVIFKMNSVIDKNHLKFIDSIDNSLIEIDHYEYKFIALEKNGHLNTIGVLDSLKRRNGIWLGYIDNVKSCYIEKLQINNKEYDNQIWGFNREKMIVYGNSYGIKLKHNEKDSSFLYTYLPYESLSRTSDIFLCIPDDETELELDFTNYKNITWDTIESVKTIKIKQNLKLDKYDNHRLFVPISKKQNRFQAILVETEKQNNDSISYREIFINEDLNAIKKHNYYELLKDE